LVANVAEQVRGQVAAQEVRATACHLLEGGVDLIEPANRLGVAINGGYSYGVRQVEDCPQAATGKIRRPAVLGAPPSVSELPPAYFGILRPYDGLREGPPQLERVPEVFLTKPGRIETSNQLQKAMVALTWTER
jgi:hypothetical protein